MKKVDLLDRKILRVISVDARRSFKEIAEQCGVSRAAIHQRVVRMFDRGTITGSGYQINPKYLGFGTCSYIGIRLEKGSMYNAVVQELMKIPEVVECHFTTGKYDIFIKLYARNNSHLLQIIHDRLQNLVSVRTESLISFKEVFKRQIPIDERP